jgi:hypothetical protein
MTTGVAAGVGSSFGASCGRKGGRSRNCIDSDYDSDEDADVKVPVYSRALSQPDDCDTDHEPTSSVATGVVAGIGSRFGASWGRNRRGGGSRNYIDSDYDSDEDADVKVPVHSRRLAQFLDDSDGDNTGYDSKAAVTTGYRGYRGYLAPCRRGIDMNELARRPAQPPDDSDGDNTGYDSKAAVTTGALAPCRRGIDMDETARALARPPGEYKSNVVTPAAECLFSDEEEKKDTPSPCGKQAIAEMRPRSPISYRIGTPAQPVPTPPPRRGCLWSCLRAFGIALCRRLTRGRQQNRTPNRHSEASTIALNILVNALNMEKALAGNLPVSQPGAIHADLQEFTEVIDFIAVLESAEWVAFRKYFKDTNVNARKAILALHVLRALQPPGVDNGLDGLTAWAKALIKSQLPRDVHFDGVFLNLAPFLLSRT